jgi:hypothetical protein
MRTQEEKEKRRLERARYREKYPDRIKAQRRAYYERNKERLLAASKAWRANNPERMKSVDKAWKAANPDKVKARKARYIERHREKVLEANREWKRLNPEKVAMYRARAKAKRMASLDNARAERAAIARTISSHEILARIKAALPSRFNRSMRDDAMAEMYVRLMDGEISFNDIEKAAVKYINREYSRFTALSLFDTIPGTKSLTWMEQLPDGVLHF